MHEAYLRLVRQDQATWQNRAQFFAVASQMMRRILVDRARAQKMEKRSGRWNRVTLVEDAAKAKPLDVDMLDLDAALEELAAFDARKARVAELRFFGGLSLEEIGGVLDISLADGDARLAGGAGVAVPALAARIRRSGLINSARISRVSYQRHLSWPR